MSLARKVRFSAALVAATMLTNVANAYTIRHCSNAGEAAIDQLQIDRAKISDVRTDTQFGGRARFVSGYHLWLTSNACKGSLVLSLRADCRFIDTFSRGDCSLADFKK